MKNFTDKEIIPEYKALKAITALDVKKIKPRPLSALFYRTNGKYSCNKKMLQDDGLRLNNKAEKDIKGLYILYKRKGKKEIPQYVGISGKVLCRLKQHVFSKSHYAASLVYLMAKTESKYTGPRSNAILEKYGKAIRDDIYNKWSVRIIPCNCSYKLALNEIVLAVKLKTKWNSFQTH